MIRWYDVYVWNVDTQVADFHQEATEMALANTIDLCSEQLVAINQQADDAALRMVVVAKGRVSER